MKVWTRLVAAVCFTAWVATADNKEPQYQGRSLSDWAKQIDPHGLVVIEINGVPVKEPPEQTAIKSIGTNAIPTLLEWIKQKDPPDSEGKRTCFDTTPGKRAEMCFGILGEDARPAIPALTKLALTLADRERYERCIRSLAEMGADALPSFQTILTKGRTGARWEALCWLAVYRSNAFVALPEAINCLTSKDEDLSWKATDELSRLDIPDSALIPALTNALLSASAASRARIIRCLYWRDKPAFGAVSSLRHALTDRNKQVRWEATNALKRIAPEVLTNAPAH